ncbi:MAG: hypothetical protein ACFFBD_05905 [Candidatus Hodarchaeota archaeon]
MKILEERRTGHSYWLVTQDLEIQNDYKTGLKEQGYPIKCFNSTEEVLDALLTYRKGPDIYLIDYHLPKNSGMVLFRVLRNLSSNSKIIFLNTNPGIKIAVPQAGAPLILHYPKPEELIEKSNQLINQAQNFIALFYENESQLLEKILAMIKSVISLEKCVLLVSNPQKTLDRIKQMNINLDQIDINVMEYNELHLSKLLALYLNCLKDATENGYLRLYVIVDLSPITSLIDKDIFQKYVKAVKCFLNALMGEHYLMCIYPSNLSPEFQEVILKTHDRVLYTNESSLDDIFL